MELSRRTILKGLSAAGVAGFAGAALSTPESSTPMKTLTPLNEPHPITPVPIEDVVIADEFWSPKRKVWRTVTLRDCFKKFEELKGGAFNNFDRVRDGSTGSHAGPPWYDGLVYEMIRGAADFMRNQPDPELEIQIDGYIARIVAAAEKDPGGYVNTYTQLEEPSHRWGLNGGLEVWQHEFYNLGALVEAGVHYYRATRKTALLDAAVHIANTMCDLVQPKPGKNLVPAHELAEEAMLGLYELLEEQPDLKGKLKAPANSQRYLALAQLWVENRGHNSGKPDWQGERSRGEDYVRKADYSEGRPSWGVYAQDDKPVFEQEGMVGHAVRSTLLCSAVAALAKVNGREDYRGAAVRLWENMVYRRMHITGGVGAFANDEAFGPDYVLPNDAYLETCAAVGAGFFHHNMNQLFGDARFADELERALYNGVLCGVSLAGDTYTYQNPLIGGKDRARWSWHDCPCCPPMFLKIMGAMPGYIYSTDADSAYVNLYVGGHAKMEVCGTEIVLSQKTRYPWDGKVQITVEKASPSTFALMLRVPSWSKSFSVRVNGEAVSIERVRGYARVSRLWKKGDLVEIEMPMPVELVRAHPLVSADIGRVALMRGPLVYCFESADGSSPSLLRFGSRPSFSSKTWEEKLGGVVAIQASTVSPAEEEPLYASEPRRSGKTTQVTAIPYYANANRGPAEMAVWIPQEA